MTSDARIANPDQLASCSVLGRAHDIAAGQMPFLDPGEVRTSWLTIEARVL